MKLLIVGSDKIYAIENFYVKYLREFGVNVSQFSAQSLFYDYYQESLNHKLIYKAGLSGIIKEINGRFINQVESFKPDVIWIFKGMEILPASVKWAKNRGIKLINYNPDSPFIFSGKGSGNKNVTESIPYYDLFLTYNPEDKLIMEMEYNIPSSILPFGFNLEEDVYQIYIKAAEKRKLCFLGNPDKQRAGFLEQLAECGLVMDVYGNDWREFVKHPNISIYNPVYENSFWEILRMYRVQLNLMRPHNPASHNMRSFEAAGIGAVQLAPDTVDHRKYFESGSEIFLYKDVESCFTQAKILLNMDEQEILSIRNNTRLRALRDGYTYKDRAAQALILIEKING